VRDGEGPDEGCRDGPGVGAQVEENVDSCVGDGEGSSTGASDVTGAGARCRIER
jgi:hypothetical protein